MNELMRFHCPKCGKRLKAAVEHAGRKARCGCGEAVTVPLARIGTEAPPESGRTGDDRWLADPPTMTTLHPAPVAPARQAQNSVAQPTWRSIVDGSAAHTFELRYRGAIDQVWQAILEYVQKLPDLTVLQTTESPRQIIYQSRHFRQLIVVTLKLANQSGETDIAVHLFDDLTQPETADHKNPALRLFAYAALKTQALDPKFRQTGGVGGPKEARSNGLWKMIGGALLCLAGLVLTALTQGQVFFYGAILWGGFLFIAGLWQTISGRNVE